MRNEYHGLVGVVRQEALHQDLFGLLIQRSAELVQQQDIPFSKQSSSNGDPLRLPFAQSAALLSANGIQPFKQILLAQLLLGVAVLDLLALLHPVEGAL